jgi:hypothetical protein
MGRPVNEALQIGTMDLLFELADQRHCPVKTDPILDAQSRGCLVARASTFLRRLGHLVSLP